MHEGTIEQWASAYDRCHKPRTRFIADFVGQGVFLRGMATSPDASSPSSASSRPRCRSRLAKARGRPLVRPDDIVHDDESPWKAEVAAKAFRGADFVYTLKLSSGTRVLSLVPRITTTRSASASGSASRSITSSRSRRPAIPAPR